MAVAHDARMARPGFTGNGVLDALLKRHRLPWGAGRLQPTPDRATHH